MRPAASTMACGVSSLAITILGGINRGVSLSPFLHQISTFGNVKKYFLHSTESGHYYHHHLPSEMQSSNCRLAHRGFSARLKSPVVRTYCTASSASLNSIHRSGPGLHELLENSQEQRFVFFGGKGGVGKTSVSAAVALKCADKGMSTLLVSTDPAHSLGDVLDQPVGGGMPVYVNGCENLSAMEIDVEKATLGFQEILAALDPGEMAASLGIDQSWVENLGIREFSELLKNPPPGIDELVALAKVIDLSNREKEGVCNSGQTHEPQQYYNRIIIDTAPTGHTLRLLSFPDFLDKFLDQLIQLRSKLGGLLSLVQTMAGNRSMGRATISEKAELALQKLSVYKDRMVELKELFRDVETTEFCVVTTPTDLAVLESSRLLSSLSAEGISTRHLIVNQVLPLSIEADSAYLQRIVNGQKDSLKKLQQIPGLNVTEVPYFDMEVIGIYPLRYMAQVAFKQMQEIKKEWRDLLTAPKQRFVIFGGKGGVGKTTSSASMAVLMADEGYNTVVVSSDPAHSLGDSLEMNLRGKGLVEVPGVTGSGRLFALEIDTEGAAAEFKTAIDDFLQKEQERGGQASHIFESLSLRDFTDILNSAPPGMDELVALSKVLKLLQGENDFGLRFDRVIIDTAPTGHTLRLLKYPQFLDDFFDHLIQIRDKFKGATAFFGLFQGGNSFATDSKGKADRDILREYQVQMMQLQELFQDEELSQFVVVSIPTALAGAESMRLVQSLRDQEMAVRNLLINKVLEEDTTSAYIGRMARAQGKVEAETWQLGKDRNMSVTRVPLFDIEIRNIHGLRAMAGALFG
eukprot:391245_1